MRRVVRPELLDSRLASPGDVRSSLADLQRINRWFGGTHTTKHLIGRVLSRVPQNRLSILDVGSATGDGPQKLHHTFPAASLNFTLLDRDPSHFSANHRPPFVMSKSAEADFVMSRRSEAEPRYPYPGNSTPMPRVAADALSLPFRNNTFDLVLCSLFAHHLEPYELRAFANEALRVSRTALLINDLRRSYFHLGLVYAGQPLFRSPLTHHDTIASVRRAYTVTEMQDILKKSTASRIEIHNSYFYRMGAIAWK